MRCQLKVVFLSYKGANGCLSEIGFKICSLRYFSANCHRFIKFTLFFPFDGLLKLLPAEVKKKKKTVTHSPFEESKAPFGTRVLPNVVV